MWNREIELRHNHPLLIRQVATIECKAGTIWVTSSKLAGDLFLHAGERRRVPAGVTLVEALGSARIVLRPVGLRRLVREAWDFLVDWAGRRARQYAGVYLHSR